MNQTAPKSPRIISIVNQKGGVGKTTTTVNLATALAAVGKKVMVIDFDPQGNASTGLGIDHEHRIITSYDLVIEGANIKDAILPTAIPGLSIVTATMDLSGAEIELVSLVKREFRLKDALNTAPLPFDYVLIDCPPSLGLLTLNALVASQSVLIPLQCEFYALEGLSHLAKTIQLVSGHLNTSLDILGILLTMYDRRNRFTEQVEWDVRDFFAEKVFNTVIPRNIRISEAPSHGKPAIIYDMNCAGSRAYLKLAAEVLKREKAREAEKEAA